MQKVSCFTTVGRGFFCFAIASMVLICQQSGRSEEPSPNRKLDSIVGEELRTAAIAEMRIRKALQEQTVVEFIETPLIDVIEFLEEQHDIQIEIVTSALDAIGIGSDTPITRNLKGVSLQAALKLMLADMDLTFVVHDEVLQITTLEAAEQIEITRVYNVGDLVDEKRPIGDLVDALTIGSVREPHGSGAVVSFGDCLIVVANHARQNRIARLLALLRVTQGRVEAKGVQHSLGLYPLGDGPAAQLPKPYKRLKEPRKADIADPFGEGVPAPSKPKPKSKPAGDPFGGGKSDPFGGGGADPFGGDGTDPFGGGGVDPFGDDSDPPGR